MQTKIDCSIAENYLKESNRMCKFYDAICKGCPIENTWKEVGSCRQWNIENPQQSIEIVQQWSDEHPIEPVVTYLDKLLEVFPNTELMADGTPNGFCPSDLGMNEINCSNKCKNCWSQPYKENDK